MRIDHPESKHLWFAHDMKEADPSSEIAVDSLDRMIERAAPVPPSQLDHLAIDSLARPRREPYHSCAVSGALNMKPNEVSP